MSTASHFEVRRDDLRRSRFTETELAPPAPGEVELRVDRFALTANNVTYAVAGDAMRYWSFFPAEAGWGRVPVWGFADVARSALSELAAGERVYGYFPMSTHLVVRPESLGPASFVDGAAHRAGLPPVYNQYRRVAADPGYERALEDRQAVLQPLFVTGWLLADLVADEAASARSVVIASASSKTAIALAASLAGADGVERVGLTSPRNAPFVEKLGHYDRVVPYDAIPRLSVEGPAVLIDMAGDAAVKAAVHERLGPQLARSIAVGVTHWEQGSLQAQAPTLPGPKPEFFFAPSRIQKRSQEWGARALQQKIGEAWRNFALDSRRWLEIEVVRGRDAVARAFRATVEGEARPDRGLILSL